MGGRLSIGTGGKSISYVQGKICVCLDTDYQSTREWVKSWQKIKLYSINGLLNKIKESRYFYENNVESIKYFKLKGRDNFFKFKFKLIINWLEVEITTRKKVQRSPMFSLPACNILHNYSTITKARNWHWSNSQSSHISPFVCVCVCV